LRVRHDARQLRRRQRGGGKQHEAKFGHDDLDPRNELWFPSLAMQGL
jgi:hypothetical protein